MLHGREKSEQDNLIEPWFFLCENTTVSEDVGERLQKISEHIKK